MQTYRIKNWDEHYENNRTRDLKVLNWVPIPNKLDSDGYTLIMEKKNGAAIFGAWIACVEVASKCRPRGTLVRDSNTPHNLESLSRITRMQKSIIKEMLDICTNECKWIEHIDLQSGAIIPQDNAIISQDTALKERKKEGNGKKEGPENYFVFIFNNIDNKELEKKFNDTFNNFLEMRKKIRKPATDRAIELILIELKNLSKGNIYTAIKILEKSIKSSWQDVYEFRDDTSATSLHAAKPELEEGNIKAKIKEKLNSNVGITESEFNLLAYNVKQKLIKKNELYFRKHENDIFK